MATKKKTNKKGTKKKKRVNFPWVKKTQTKTLKYFLAYYLEKIGFAKVIKGKLGLNKYVKKKVIPEIYKKFPSVYLVIKKYYKRHGRKLTKTEYENLLCMRVNAMFHYRKGDKKVRKKSEHPDKTKKKSKKCAKIARLLIGSEKTYDSLNGS